MASKAALETLIRNDVLASISDMLQKKFDTDILVVSASELAVPVLDAEGNEKFAVVKVSIPRGTRNGEGGYTEYDGYAAAEMYQEDLAGREAKSRRAQKRRRRLRRKRNVSVKRRKLSGNLIPKGLTR